MKPLLTSDLDAMAREAVKSGGLASLSHDQHIAPRCHPASGVKITRAYEGDYLMLSCTSCNRFICNIKIAQE